MDAPLAKEKIHTPHEVLLRGWMFSPEGRTLHGTASVDGMPDVIFTTKVERLDVVQHFQEKGLAVPATCGFELTVPLPENGKSIVDVSLTFTDGVYTTKPQSYSIERPEMFPWPPPPARTTLISHFYNEEYLLPLWLRHHVPLFDHGILINRGSTDRSAAICRELAPHWEVRDASCLEFDAEEVDQEVMAVERECTGWKFVLNTTEFLHVHSKESFLAALHTYGRRAYGIHILLLMDPEQARYPEFDPGKPLAAQRHHGCFQTLVFAFRYIHNHEDGRYSTGRHATTHVSDFFPRQGAVILKMYLTPWNEPFRRRKLQIRPTLSQKSREKNLGYQHVGTADELEDFYKSNIGLTTDLRKMRDLAWVFHQR
ncbi:glycosyltransferase family 2 protein [Roseimicrobium sp. ORNL1]|uniref:glycosyltransferase family 2 protein n=1 Tax=Roseimicrobium sp. ORNL1 TaxID=2711231 RepID=UPI00197E8B8B|nr:glycosyltransferase family 2 protein [Roseimicrobium sp. ORNL1]